MKGKKFVVSYSGGKDSALALYRGIKEGMIPHKLLTTYNSEGGKSWFHGLSSNILKQISGSLEIPVHLIETKGEDYEKNFEHALNEMKEEGAEVCIFGDIDIEDHRKWCTQRCENVGIHAYFPLWNESRKSLVYEFIDSGFKTMITIIDTTRMDEKFLGETLTRQIADKIEGDGTDICGENGEYHSFTYDGPIFKKKIDFSSNNKFKDGKHVYIKVE